MIDDKLYTLLYDTLVDETLSFEENKYLILRARGFYVNKSFSLLDEKYLCIAKSGQQECRENLNTNFTVSEILKMDSYSKLLELFSKDTVANYEVTTYLRNNRIHKWAKGFASGSLRGMDVYADQLEPFIAKYIRELNKIGTKTRISCDGWHRDGKKMYVGFLDCNSMIWHKIVSDFLPEEFKLPWAYHNDVISILLPTNDKDKLQLYKKSN